MKLLGIAATVLVVAAAASPAQGENALVGYWKLDGGNGTTAADSSGLGNNGTLTGNVGWGPGITDGGLSFDGGSGSVQVPDNSSLEPPISVSVGAWFRHLGSPGDYRYILAKGGTGCTSASYGLYSGPNGGLQFYVSQQHGGVYARSPDAGLRVWDGNWHLAVGTFDGTTIRLYVDGQQIGSGTVYPGSLQYPLTSSNDLFIGNYPKCQNQDYTFLGDIDDVTLWNQALSAATVKLMAGGDTAPPVPGGSTPGQAPSGSDGAGGRAVGSPDGGPALKLLAMTPNRFVADGARSRGRGTGSAISYVDSKAARSTFIVLQRQTGRRKGSRCVGVAGGHRPMHGPRCLLYVAVGKFRHSDHVGMNRFHFGGEVDRRRLSPGAYLLDATPSTGGRVGRTASTAFEVIA